MRQRQLAIFLLGCSSSKKAKLAINEDEVTRIETTLSHDSMEGRKTFTRGIDKAAAFIASEMKLSGLQFFRSAAGYLQSFEMINGTAATASVTIDGISIPATNVICASSNETITFTEADKYTIVTISKADTFRNKIRTILNKKQNTLVLVDSSFSRNFRSLNQIKGPAFASDINQVFVLTGDMDVSNYSVNITQSTNK